MIQPTNTQIPMQYPQQGGANAVAINIYNPQAYGSTPTAQTAQNVPYQVQQPVYQMPYAPAYTQGATNPMAYQQFMPVNNVMNAPMAPEAQVIAPMPQEMPQSVITPEASVSNEAQVQQAPAQQTEATPEIAQTQQAAQVVDVDSILQGLKSADPNVKAQTINQISSYAQESPEIAYQVVSEPIMQSLVDIINEDTKGLQGPTKEQQAVAEKLNKGETLTAQEQAIADETSPLDMANHNRTIAVYVLAMLQKLQRDELKDYIANQVAQGEQPLEPLAIQDLIGYNDMVNVIKNDPSLKVRVAALEALQHIVEPQDKATVEPILQEAKKSSIPDMTAIADDTLAKLAA